MLLIILYGLIFCSQLCLCKYFANTTVKICAYLSRRQKTSSLVPWTTDLFLWKKSLPKNSHYFWSLHTKLQLSWGQASTLLKPFSACHPPAGTSSSSTESRASTSGGKAFLLYFVRRSSWASTSMSPVWGDNKTTQRKFRGSLFGTATKNFVLSKHQETYSILLSLGVVSQDRGPAFPRDTVYFGSLR